MKKQNTKQFRDIEIPHPHSGDDKVMVVIKYCKNISEQKKYEYKRNLLLCIRSNVRDFLLITDDMILKAGFDLPIDQQIILYFPDVSKYESFYSYCTGSGFILKPKKNEFKNQVEKLLNIDNRIYPLLFLAEEQLIYDVYAKDAKQVRIYELTDRDPDIEENKKLDDMDGYDSPKLEIADNFKQVDYFTFKENGIQGRCYDYIRKIII